MINTLCSRATVRLALLALTSLFLMNGCAPPATGPSAALKQQFAQLQQQQQQQAGQLAALQAQLEQLLQRPLDGQSTVTLTPGPPTSVPDTGNERLIIPSAISEEVSALADSAAVFLAAFSNLAAGRYAVSETGFTTFLTNYPEHQYAPNARYWLASAQLSQGKLQLAASTLRQVIVDHNGQQRAPAALVMLAKVYQQQHLNNEADEVLEQLRSRYPESSEAQQFYLKDQSQQ